MNSWLLGTLGALVLALLPWQAAQAQPTLTWLMREFPPLTIFEGPQKGQGAVDQMLAQLTLQMPQYHHIFLRVNRARSTQMLKERGLYCDPTLLWSGERARFVTFSLRAFATLSNGLIVRVQDLPLLQPYMVNGAVNLPALLDKSAMQVGIVPGRSYGQVIDPMLAQAPAQALVPHYGNDATSNLMQMEHLGRVQAFLGYWTEVRYLAQQQGIALNTLRFLPVLGDSHYKFTHIGCSKTPEGATAVQAINAQLRPLRQNTLPPLYARWLDEGMRQGYLQDAKRFFAVEDRAAGSDAGG
ncbi:TIGR02285 family protein [Pseudomonas typographi]|uniref:TIGR02285 family protein n=1 Tax=Pseudomonas typographi TaxID=2715964 RepID=A0ABR7Z7E3_9PSED|nr:TIGR02285 family protein [Pseudomonas typographi]MBD1601456.1 TIGR02285 family protein [Pseudomonas typographi]